MTGPGTTFSRKGDWEAALAEYVAARRDWPFAWGEHDCFLFVAGAIAAMTGFDPAVPYRGRYRSMRGSLRVLRKGPGTLENLVDGLFPRVEPAFARRGDVAWYQGGLGVVLGPFAAFVGEAGGVPGLVRVDRADWEGAWSVG